MVNLVLRLWTYEAGKEFKKIVFRGRLVHRGVEQEYRDAAVCDFQVEATFGRNAGR